MKTEEELVVQAMAERAAAIGKLLKVTFAMIGDGSDLWDKNYPKEDPLVVRVTDILLNPDHDVSYHDDEGGLIDTYWDVEPLPGQLAKGEHVSCIDGPTYYLDGRRTTSTWVGEPYEG